MEPCPKNVWGPDRSCHPKHLCQVGEKPQGLNKTPGNLFKPTPEEQLLGSPPLTCHMCTSLPPDPQWCGTRPAAADRHARSMRDASSPSFLSLYPQHQSPVYNSSIIFFPARTLVTRRVSKKPIFYWCYREGNAEVGPRNMGVPPWRN